MYVHIKNIITEMNLFAGHQDDFDKIKAQQIAHEDRKTHAWNDC